MSPPRPIGTSAGGVHGTHRLTSKRTEPTFGQPHWNANLAANVLRHVPHAMMSTHLVEKVGAACVPLACLADEQSWSLPLSVDDATYPARCRCIDCCSAQARRVASASLRRRRPPLALLATARPHLNTRECPCALAIRPRTRARLSSSYRASRIAMRRAGSQSISPSGWRCSPEPGTCAPSCR